MDSVDFGPRRRSMYHVILSDRRDKVSSMFSAK